MFRRVVGLVLAFGAGFLTVAASAVTSAADDPKPTDWSAWVTVGSWTGEITKASRNNKGFFVRTSAPATGAKGGAPKTLELLYADGGLVRWAKLPPKLDEKGKEAKRTADELAELKKPTWAKGFAADRKDLTTGRQVEVLLVRPKELAEKDVRVSDYRVKTVTITGDKPSEPEPKKGKGKQ